MPSGQVWATGSLGGNLSAKNLNKKLRHELTNVHKFRQMANVESAVKKHAGETFHWDFVSKTANKGGTLVETNVMPETNLVITQGTMTITEYGQGVPWTAKLQTLSEHDVDSLVIKPLKEDAKDRLDAGPWEAMDSTLLTCCPTGGTSATAVTLTTSGTETGTNNVAFAKAHVGAIVDIMKERNIPPYVAEDYYAIAWPTTYRTMKNSLESVKQYTTEGYQEIKKGVIGRFDNVRFIEQTNIAKGGAVDSTTHNWYTADAWNNAKSDWIFFLGGDACAEGVAIREEVRFKEVGDYQRSHGVAWYYLGGFAKNALDATNEKIIKWDSAV